MNTQRSILAIAIAVGLSACGGGGSGSDTNNGSDASSSYTARAADGYLEGAVACLDLNGNKACDDDEPSAVTDENGEFTITGLTQAQKQNGVVVIEIVPGQTVDQDNPGVPLTKAYTLTAPPGSEFISPLTTLVQNEVEKGRSVDEAKAVVKSQLGSLGADIDLDEDYVQAKVSNSMSEAERDAYAELHKVAQVAASVMANITDSLDAAEGGIEEDELKELIVEQVLKVVEDALTAIGNAGDDFDIDDIVDNLPLDLTQENLKDKLDELEAVKEAEDIDFKQALESDQLAWFDSYEPDDMAQQFSYGLVQLDGEGQFIEREYEFDYQTQSFLLQGGDDQERQMILSENGWVASDYSVVAINAQDDGSVIFEKAVPELNEQISADRINISNLNVRELIADSDDTAVWAHYIGDSLVFPTNSVAYKVEAELVAEGYYSFDQGDWCEKDPTDRYETLGNMCNGISAYTVNGDTWLSTLDSTVAQDASDRSGTNNTTDLIPMAGATMGIIFVQLLESGEAVYYLDAGEKDSLTKYDELGDWQDIEHNGQTLREITLPDSIAEQTTWSNFNDEDNALYLARYGEYLRVAWYIEDDYAEGEELLFGQSAAQFVIDSFQPMNLATCLASLSDADYEKQVGDIWQQNVERSVPWANEGNPTSWRYELEHMGDNFSWLTHESTQVTDLPEQLSGGALTQTVIRAYDASNTIAFVEKQYEDQDHYYGQAGRGEDNSNWGSVKVILPTPVKKSELLLGKTIMHEDAAIASLSDVTSAEAPTSVDALQRQHFTYTQQFLGKRNVEVESGEYEVCQVVNFTYWGEGSGHFETDTSLVWLNNRGVVKQLRDEPSWGAKIELEVESMPEIN
ncbi:hypothetical protein [Vibrio sinaloensis]|uniref:hypothetical protein n=1 Tax=Photobacterium sp. (strain ATCC 43367) TaxID=379097 RepID=UPI0035E793F0